MNTSLSSSSQQKYIVSKYNTKRLDKLQFLLIRNTSLEIVCGGRTSNALNLTPDVEGFRKEPLLFPRKPLKTCNDAQMCCEILKM